MPPDSSSFSSEELYHLAQEAMATPESIPPAPLDQTSERYQHKNALGEGGMKIITCVYDLLLCRNIALAQLRPECEAARCHQFLNEARLTAQLDHPNIIKVHDMGTDAAGHPFFTMDLKTGQTLAQIIRERPHNATHGDVASAIEIFLKVCEAVAYAHSRDLVHLDLKPANIQIGEFGEVVLCDWGLGTSLKRLSLEDIESNPFYGQFIHSKPSENRVTGTPGFMAPEQYDAALPKDKRTDVFGLGALLFTQLTGHPPRKNTSDVLTETITKAQLNESLEAICLKCLATNPAARYPTAQELIDDVRRYKTGYTTTAEASGFGKELHRLLRRNHRLSLTIGISMIILLVSTALFMVHQNESKNNEQQARLEAEKSEQKARQALRLYEDEKRALNALDLDYSNSLNSLTEMQQDLLFYERPTHETLQKIIETTEKVLKRNPNNRSEIHRQGNIYLIEKKYEKARAAFQKVGRKAADLSVICDELVNTPRFQTPVSPDAFAEIIQLMGSHSPRRKHLVHQLFTFDHSNRTSLNGYAPVVEAILHYYNPGWRKPTFDYDASEQSLKIGGKNLAILMHPRPFYSRSFLAVLPIKKLDLSHTKLFSLSHLTGITELEELNISHTLVSEPPRQSEFPKLKTLILSKEQFKRDVLLQLPDSIELRFE